jgi:uncharacterized protein involved in exopolysaccharide biosynthesis
MARIGVSEQQVHDAADALLRAGERPTIERVRIQLGTGSPNTLLRYLDSWWAALGRRLSEQSAKLALPEAPAEVVAAASNLWDIALAHAQSLAAQGVRQEQTALEQERASLVALERELQARVTSAQTEVEQAKEAQALAETRLVDVERLTHEFSTQIADLKAQRASLLAEREELAQRLTATEKRFIDQANAFAADRAALEAHSRTNEDRAHVEIDRARQEAKGLRTRLDRMEHEASQVAHAARQRETELRQVLVRVEQVSAEERTRLREGLKKSAAARH